ncbi:MAG TPA: hypothetical protein VFE32_06770 [Puia sp.]|jgi:hypothetical protein|nr:hypothetical protein [Puia sp.]
MKMKTEILTRRVSGKLGRLLAMLAVVLTGCQGLRAQTDDDALMMAKNNLCVGGTYSHSNWNYYWEGTYHRNNQNLGTVTTQMVGLMGIYGINRHLAVVGGAPYVWTGASAGVLHGMHGIQDLSGWLKWQPVEQRTGSHSKVSVFAMIGGSVPLTNYLADYLPLSIGLHSRTASGRIIADYQLGHFFATGVGTYTWRSNVTIDEQSYYTTSFHETNQVQMPNMASWLFRTGYRTNQWIVEGLLSDMITLGGFDIRKNDMPFPSNRMNSLMAGAHVKYEFHGKPLKGLSLTADGMYTLTGRNVGQATTIDAGVFYIFDFAHKRHTVETPTLKTR